MGVATLQRPATKQQAPGRYHWTVDSFYRAVDAGVFDEPNRLELINGDIRTKEQVNPPHAILTEEIARLFRQLFEPTFRVREEKPIHIANDGEPVPDVAVVAEKLGGYRKQHPTPEETLLVVEVAYSSEDYDKGDKARLYAAGGVKEYWLSLIKRRQLLVYRNPVAGRYGEPVTLTEQDSISALGAPDVAISVGDLIWRSELTEETLEAI